MRLNEEQRKKAEENMGLVGKVIKDRVHGLGRPGMISFEDLFQTGCVGLCKAAATDKGGGSFSTYAYRLIWNEISDALARHNRMGRREQEMVKAIKEESEGLRMKDGPAWEQAYVKEMHDMLSAAGERAGGVVSFGIRALELSAQGYGSREVGRIMGAKPGTVRMWMTRARRYLKERPGISYLSQSVKKAE